MDIERLTLASSCAKCSGELEPPAKRNTVYLERSATSGRYYPRGALPAGHRSDGVQPYCKACAGTLLGERGVVRG
jgi:hypothetical protein